MSFATEPIDETRKHVETRGGAFARAKRGGRDPHPTAFAARATGQLALLQHSIPSSGESLPIIGLGTGRAFDADPSAAERQPLEEVLALFNS